MAEKVSLQKSYANLNEKLIDQFDGAGVRRSFTVPYIEGQAMDQHIGAVGQAAVQAGGLANNLLVSAHHSEGEGWGSGDGHTTAHPVDKLRSTVIPPKDEKAEATIAAAQNHLNNIEKLLGDEDPAVQTAKGQLDLVKQTNAAGMNLLDFGVMMTQIMYGPNQAVARAHSGTKDGGHAPHLRAPGAAAQEAPETSETAQGGTQPAEDGSEDHNAASAAPTASEAQASPAGAAPAAPAQG